MTVVPAMRRVNVLFMPHPAAIDPSWGDDVVAAIAGSHELRVFDPEREAGPQFQKVEAIVDLGGNISGKLVDAAADAGVRFIQAQTNGLDHVEVDRILDAGMILCHCPGHLSGVALADRAMMFVLMLAHRYDEGRRTFMRGELYSPNGMEPEGRSLAIIGFGNSGQLLARRARAFGMRILGIDVRPIEQRVLDELQPEYLGGPDDLDRVVAQCDFLSPHLHLTDETSNHHRPAAHRPDEADGLHHQRRPRRADRRGGAVRGAARRATRRGGPRRVRSMSRRTRTTRSSGCPTSTSARTPPAERTARRATAPDSPWRT